jgi:adenylate kinase family enzyme
MPNRIHIFGASGSGTTSLAAAVASKYGHRHFDADDFYWLPTDPPYQQKRPPEARLALLRSASADRASWVISGSLCGWGDPLIPQFELVVFIVVSTEIRLTRLRAREIERYGRSELAAGGKLHRTHLDFLDWAERYDTGGMNMRSRGLHEAWLARLPGAVLRLAKSQSIADQLSEIEAAINAGIDPSTG